MGVIIPQSIGQIWGMINEKAWNNKRIGVAVSESIEGPWERTDIPILEPRPGKWDAAITSNPAPVIHEDGSVLLIYKSAPYGYPKRNTHYAMHFGAARAKHYLGPYSRVSEDNMITIAGVQADVEDPYIWHDGVSYRMLAKSMDASVTGEEGAGFFAYSHDGINWQLTENPAAYSKTIVLEGGAEKKMKRLERPQVLLQNGAPTHVFFASIHPGGDIFNIVRPLNNLRK